MPGPLPIVGLLVDSLELGYQWSLVRGAANAARIGGAHLLCFAGGVLGGPPGSDSDRNAVFDLASSPTVDGLVVAAGAIGNRVGPERLQQYCARYRPLPMCSVAVELGGASFVSIDNESGMRTAIDHLVETHGMRRIAFVRGPDANAEAERRFAAYEAALLHAGIPFAPELVAAGDFEEHSGREAVHGFDVSARSVQAIVAANDAMALGALEELTRLGIRVPEEVAVIGFDDIEEARVSLPPLTTVRQPLLDQGRDAIRIVLHQMRIGGGSERVVRLTEPVVRRSCGCLGAQPPAEPPSSGPQARSSFEEALVERRQLMVSALTRAARGRLGAAGSDWAERLVQAFSDQMVGASPDPLLRAFDDCLRRLSAQGADLSVCHEVLSALRVAALATLDGHALRRSEAENLFHEMRVVLAEATDRAQASLRIQSERTARSLAQAAAAIASSSDIEHLSAAASAHLPAVGISRCFLVARCDEGSGGTEGNGRYRLVMALNPGSGNGPPSSEPGLFADIVRREVLATSGEKAFAVLPLISGGSMSGVLIVEIGAPDGWAYEMLRDAFAASLRATRG